MLKRIGSQIDSVGGLSGEESDPKQVTGQDNVAFPVSVHAWVDAALTVYASGVPTRFSVFSARNILPK